jgi:glycosyltransferase involved in cell wall biosynthesis
MATGLPVVVSDLPANREWVSDGDNGWLVPIGARQQLADRLLTIANLRQAERDYISRRNQQIVAERADWDRNFPLLLDVYERLADAWNVAAKERG